MMIPRVIPVLLLRGSGLVKTQKFDDAKYVGDPINAVKIFNEKEVDEITLLDISATRENKAPDLARIADIASEAFMPLCYGGGIRDVKTAEKVLALGVEKVAINSAAVECPGLIDELARAFGSQSIVVSIDVAGAGKNQYEIAAEVGVSQQCISKDLVKIQLEWTTRMVGNFDEKVRMEVAKIDRRERECLEAFQRSVGVHTTVTKKNTPEGEEITEKKERLAGDARFQQLALECVDKRCKILGLYAVVKTSTEVTGDALAQLVAAARARVREARPE